MDEYRNLALRYILVVVILAVIEEVESMATEDDVESIEERHATGRDIAVSNTCTRATLILRQRDNATWKSLFGVNVQEFEQIHRAFHTLYPKPNRTGRRRRFDSRSVLAATLMWVHTTTSLQDMCKIFGATQSTMSRTVNKGAEILEMLGRVRNNV